MGPVRVKICGVTRPEEAVLAADLGADLVGLNFHPPSPRYVAPERAQEISSAVAGRLLRVGVFVNRPAAEVEKISTLADLDLIQFHGDEGVEEIRPFAERAIKVMRVRRAPAAAELEPYENVWGFLLDALHPTLYGGSGTGWRFETLRHLATERPVFIAGGLAPGRAAAAIDAARPYGIDVCSGVESAPGVKDPDLMRQLLKEVHDGQVEPPA